MSPVCFPVQDHRNPVRLYVITIFSLFLRKIIFSFLDPNAHPKNLSEIAHLCSGGGRCVSCGAGRVQFAGTPRLLRAVTCRPESRAVLCCTAVSEMSLTSACAWLVCFAQRRLQDILEVQSSFSTTPIQPAREDRFDVCFTLAVSYLSRTGAVNEDESALARLVQRMHHVVLHVGSVREAQKCELEVLTSLGAHLEVRLMLLEVVGAKLFVFCATFSCDEP